MALLLLRLVPGCSVELEGRKRGDHLRKFQQSVERSMMRKTCKKRTAPIVISYKFDGIGMKVGLMQGLLFFAHRQRTTFGPCFHGFLSSGLSEKAYVQIWRSALDWLESQQGFASAALPSQKLT